MNYEDSPGGAKPAKGERAAVLRFLESGEPVLIRVLAKHVLEDDGRTVLTGAVVVVVTDRKVVLARTSGGFRPRWETMTLPYGHLEPGIAPVGETGTEVVLPTSGRRSYRIGTHTAADATRLAATLGQALGDYRRDRMRLPDL